MHHRQNILDAAVSALTGMASLTGGATSARFFDQSASASARVWFPLETLPVEERVLEEDIRTLTLQVQVYVAGDDVQRTMNGILEEVEGGLASAIEAVADCAWLESVGTQIEADQDNESMTAELNYSVGYSTAVGDPATRV